METPVTLPLWQFVLLVTLALWASLTLFFVPGVRWFLRQRVNRVIERVDARLHIRLQPFKMTKRRVLIERLIYDPAVLQAMDEYVEAEGLSREVCLARIERYAREIVPAFNAYAYFSLGYWCSRKVASSLYRLRLGSTDDSALASIPPSSTVVFVMNHRSNMDYVMVSYLAASRTALSYAVGEWARIWPLQQLVRSMGAYFVRRRSRNALYRKVLERYVQMATRSGVTQAIFPEGRLSCDGRLGEPRVGLLDYMLRDFEGSAQNDVVFVPVGLNYDRTLEDRTLLASAKSAAARASGIGKAQDSTSGRLTGLFTTTRFLSRNLWLMLRNKWHRFGYACVNFGTPLSLAGWLRERDCADPRALSGEQRGPLVKELAEDLMGAIGKVVPVLPVALVSKVFLAAAQEELSELEIQARVHQLMGELEGRGAKLYIPRKDRVYAIQCGLRMLKLRHIVEERSGLFRAAQEELELLSYYANSIVHL